MICFLAALFLCFECFSLPEELERLGVLHEKWEVADVEMRGLDLKRPSKEWVERSVAFNRDSLERIYDFCSEEGKLDVIHLFPEMEGLDQLLERFASIHDHAAAEIRLILDGEGIFYIYTDEGKKYPIFVERGSFVFLPKNVAHNFTLTEKRNVVALRIFQDQNGWIARPIAR